MYGYLLAFATNEIHLLLQRSQELNFVRQAVACRTVSGVWHVHIEDHKGAMVGDDYPVTHSQHVALLEALNSLHLDSMRLRLLQNYTSKNTAGTRCTTIQQTVAPVVSDCLYHEPYTLHQSSLGCGQVLMLLWRSIKGNHQHLAALQQPPPAFLISLFS